CHALHHAKHGRSDERSIAGAAGGRLARDGAKVAVRRARPSLRSSGARARGGADAVPAARAVSHAPLGGNFEASMSQVRVLLGIAKLRRNFGGLRKWMRSRS